MSPVVEAVGEVGESLGGVLTGEGGVDIFGGCEVLDEVEGLAVDEVAEEARGEGPGRLWCARRA